MSTTPANTPEDSSSKPFRTRAELQALLKEAIRLAEGLNVSVSKAFPGGASRAPTAEELASMTTAEHLALGDKTIRDLKELAFKISPDRAIDFAEAELSTSQEWKAKADAVLKGLVQSGTK